MTDLEIRNEVDTFMFEGHDTTATGKWRVLPLIWLLPVVQECPGHCTCWPSILNTRRSAERRSEVSYAEERNWNSKQEITFSLPWPHPSFYSITTPPSCPLLVRIWHSYSTPPGASRSPWDCILLSSTYSGTSPKTPKLENSSFQKVRYSHSSSNNLLVQFYFETLQKLGLW